MTKKSNSLPPRPGDYANGDFLPITHDYLGEAQILEANIKSDDTITAIIKDTSYFKVTKIIVYELYLDWVENPYPPGGYILDWAYNEVAVSDGTKPIEVKKDQYIVIHGGVLVPEHAIPPGPFTGTLVVQGSKQSWTVDLKCTYLAVNENSPIGQKWKDMGGEKRFGDAFSNERPAPDGKGIIQNFVKGSIYFKQGLGTFYISEDILGKWESDSVMNTKTGSGNLVVETLGSPIEDTFSTMEGGQALRFEGGMIVLRSNQQSYVVYGDIYSHYTKFGNISDPTKQPFLGLPISDEEVFTLNPGRVSRFDNADIYWDANIGAHEIHGDIRGYWEYLQGKAGQYLGLPRTDETVTPDGEGRYNHFDNGSIYWKNGIGPHWIHGEILKRWSYLGYERSYLGYPTSDEEDWTNPTNGQAGRIMYFQHGKIGWTSQDGTIEFPDHKDFHGDVTTPAGTALGGWVDMTVRSDGSYTIHFHMHDSGSSGYDFQVRAILAIPDKDNTPTGIALVSTHSGHVGGTFSSGSRDDDYEENGINPQIQANWERIEQAKFFVTKDYDPTGVLGYFQGLLNAMADFFGTSIGEGIGLFFALTSEAHQVFEKIEEITEIGGMFVVPILNAQLRGLILATIDAIFSFFDTRPMTKSEIDFVKGVFGNTLPIDKIELTNLKSFGGRSFTTPSIDGTKTYCHMGPAYKDPVHYSEGVNGAYPREGELLIHELTHAWQIEYSDFLPGTICAGILGQTQYTFGHDVYDYGPPGPPFSSFDTEGQAAIVDQWYGGIKTAVVPFRKPEDRNDPYYFYISFNILNKQP
ncbi:hypothetical protein IIU_06558 [Bacillus cereus VD133]|uniref:Uncharacterized protein n=1 Tax=Bacillus cereus VD133 TaxID=1053233 RepID=A0A9W5PK91_BACCE|nr:hypothetical protein [Bacillus cereus]EOO24985.1 hypothetical protein IIU_06558 [Bacillus cereus VD133]